MTAEAPPPPTGGGEGVTSLAIFKIHPRESLMKVLATLRDEVL